jgi:site-specific DNA-cytosine methylase
VIAAHTEREHVFKAFLLCAGIGFGALGVKRGHARVGRASARFRILGGVDVDPIACADFRRIVGAPCTELDLFSTEQYTAFHGRPPPDEWVEATADDLRNAAGGETPDMVFWSPPCKGLSSLQTARRAASAKYQALNDLVVGALDLALAAWGDDPPALFLLENVPRIATRGRDLLERVKLRLELAGYACAETVHDCGELGGLAQHRQRSSSSRATARSSGRSCTSRTGTGSAASARCSASCRCRTTPAAARCTDSRGCSGGRGCASR